MGTRGAVGFFKAGQHKVSYNHSDSYPQGLGREIADLIVRHSIDELNAMYDKITLVDEQAKPSREQIELCIKRTGCSTIIMNQPSWFETLRNAQRNLEAYAEVGFMIDNMGFLHDSLFCEWAYIINLDENMLEIYEGFQKTRPKGRYADVPPDPDNGYYAVGLVAEIPLGSCEEGFKEFLIAHETFNRLVG